MATLSYKGILFSHSTLVPTGVNKSKQNLLEKTIKKSSITYLIPNKRPSSLYFGTMGQNPLCNTNCVLRDIHEIFKLQNFASYFGKSNINTVVIK